jgi:lipid-A-disaccharide synthase
MVAGEASGDLLGSRVIEALRGRLPDAVFCGIGGPRMLAAGFESWFPQETLAVRGFVEVLRHLPEVFAVRRALARRLAAEPPQLFVGIDAPEFNLGLERRLKRAGVVTVHLVSPQVWAWRPGRVETLRAAVSRVLVLFRFEEAIYQAAGVPVTYVGHPLADDIPERIDRDAMRVELRIPALAPVVAVLPGSRQSEIAMMAGPFIDTAKLVARRVPEVRFLVPLVTRETRALFEEELYRREARELAMTLLFGHAHDALAACDVALAASGTVTLEAALTHRAMVIAYRVTPLSFAIGKRLVRVRHIGLPNILCGEPVVPEFLQDDATPENLAQAVVNLLGDGSVRRAVERRFERLHAEMRRDAAERAADALVPLIANTPALAPQAP